MFISITCWYNTLDVLDLKNVVEINLPTFNFFFSVATRNLKIHVACIIFLLDSTELDL